MSSHKVSPSEEVEVNEQSSGETNEKSLRSETSHQDRKKLKKPSERLQNLEAEEEDNDPAKIDDEDEDEEEEEEDDDAEEASQEMKDFIVDEAADSDEVDEGGEDEEDEEEEDAGLDEDDLDLIAENMGISVERAKPAPAQQKYRRLKRPGREVDESDQAAAGSELFGEDEGPVGAEQDWRSGEAMADMEEGADGWVEEGQRGSYSMHPEIESLIVEVFGDARAVMEILGRRRPREIEEGEEEVKAKGAPKLKSEVTEQLEDDEETLIRVDQPERLFLRYRKRPAETSSEEIELEASWLTVKLISELGPDLDLSPANLLEKYKERLGPNSEHYDPKTKTVEADIKEKVALVLNFLLNQRFEVPFILTHRSHLVIPPLDAKLVWMIYEFDQEWCRLRSLSLRLQKLLAAVPDPKPSLVEQFSYQLEHFKTEEELEDIRLYLLYNYPDLEEEPAGAQSAPATNNVNRRRRQAAPGLDALRLIRKFELDTNWKPHLLTADQLAANLNKSDAFNALLSNPDVSDVPVDIVAEHPPPDEPSLPGRDANAVKSWLNSLAVGPFNTGTRVLDSLLSHEAKVLASHPVIRSLLRKWFRGAARITTVTTAAGEQSVVLGMSNWGILRLTRKPIDLFLNQPSPKAVELPSGPNAYEEWRVQIEDFTTATRIKEAFADIIKAENSHLAQVIIHPTMPSDSVPWRGENEESFLNRYPCNVRKLSELESAALAESDRQDQAQVEKLLSVLKGLYFDAGSTGWGAVVQEKILIRMLEKELFPVFRKELRQLLVRRAYAHIASRCQANLEWRLGIQPYRRPNEKPFYDRDDDSDDSESEDSSEDSDDSDSEDEDDDRTAYALPRVVSLIVERLANGCRVHAMAVDRQGMPIQYKKFDRLLELWASRRPLPEGSRSSAQKRVDTEKKALRRFLLIPDVSPDLVLIGASDLIARTLMDIVTGIKDKLKKRRRFEVKYAALEVPRIFAASELCPKEFRENYGPNGCQGIGLARFAQDPLAAQLQLWSIGVTGQNLLLDLKLHPLQDTVLRDKLESALLQTVQMAVASVGADLHQMKGQPHLQSPLQFVSGLGPNKASDLLHRLSIGNVITMREELLQLMDSSINDDDEDGIAQKQSLVDGPVGPRVYNNCASFIRIPLDSSMEGETSSDPLAASRIDPVDCYTQAQKMCRDALEDLKATSSPNDCVWAVMKRPDCLEELDLEAYSIILNSKAQQRMLPSLEFIRRELEHPFRDPRYPFESVSGARLFYFLVQEDPYQFCQGCETTACILESRAGHIRLAIPPSETPAYPTDLSDYLREETSKRRGSSLQYESSDTILPRGGMVACRLASVNFNEFTVKVVLTQQGAVDILLEKLEKELTGLLDLRFISNTISTLLSARAVPLLPENTQMTTTNSTDKDNFDNKRVFLKRRINHPRFRQANSNRSVAELRPTNIRVGEALFKPNENSNSEIILYVKVCTKPFLFKGILVQEYKQRSQGELGQELKIGNETFMDLDQILGQYVEALRINLQEVYSFEKYREGDSLESVQSALVAAQEQKAAMSGSQSIEWGIMIDPLYESNRIGVRFHLIAIPPRQPHCQPVILRDSIYVTHEGFKLWNKKEKSLRRLTNWWKQEGYFQRPHLLAEYTIAKKKRLQLQQQQKERQQQRQESMFRSDKCTWGGSPPVASPPTGCTTSPEISLSSTSPAGWGGYEWNQPRRDGWGQNSQTTKHRGSGEDSWDQGSWSGWGNSSTAAHRGSGWDKNEQKSGWTNTNQNSRGWGSG